MFSPHTQQLAYLAEVARVGTFGDAADQLDVSQSALSQGLGRLEAMAGVALFEPDGRRRRLTDAGLELAAYAERTLADTRDIERRLADRRLGTSGTLRVGMIDAAVLHHHTAAVTEYRSAHPEVDLRITVASSTVLLDRLHRFEDDLVVVVAPAADGVVTPLMDEPLHVYGPPLPADLADTRWVLYPVGSNTRAIIDEGLARMGIVPDVMAESGNPAVQRQLARLGLGWTVLPETEAAPLERRTDIVATRPIVAVRRASAARDAVADGFVAALAL